MLSLSFHSEGANASKSNLETENLPLALEQPDVLRTGLHETVALRTIPMGPSATDRRREMLHQVATQYGIGAAIRRQADLKVVEQYHRLPGLRSSFLGVEMELGEDSDLKPEDWLGDVFDSPRLQCDLHATMQKRLGLSD